MKKLISIAQKGFILDKTRKKILVNKYLESKYLPKTLIGKLCLPGGQIDFGENPDDSLIREIKEETGVTVTASLPFYTWTWIYKKDDSMKQIVAIARLAYHKSGKPKRPKGETETKLEKAKWLPLKGINIKDFVKEEQPVISKFLKYSKPNPFKLYPNS